jgi:transposase
MALDFRSHNPHQCFLLPPSPDDWLDEGHKAYFVRDVITSLDLRSFVAGYSSDGRGARAYSPWLMLSVILYGWLRGVYSCRKLASLCMDDVGARMLVGSEQPDFRSLNRFRLRHAKAIESVYLQSVTLCSRAGMVSMTDIAVDGTRVASYASNKRNIFYGRIDAEMQRHLEFLRRANECADAQDSAEDELYGEDEAGPKVPDAMKTAAGRLALLREAKAALDKEAKERADADQEGKDESASNAKRRSNTKHPNSDDARPKDSAQYNGVDPQARIQHSCQSGFLLGYNAQVGIDANSQVIVACDLVRQGTDFASLLPMVDQAISNTQVRPQRVLADRGYYSAGNVEQVEAKAITALIPVVLKPSERERPFKADLSTDEIAKLSTRNRMRHLFCQPAIKELFKKRAQSVEPVFGQIKGCPGHPRYPRFLRRGLEKCRQDWRLLCCVHNLGKLRTYTNRIAA